MWRCAGFLTSSKVWDGQGSFLEGIDIWAEIQRMSRQRLQHVQKPLWQEGSGDFEEMKEGWQDLSTKHEGRTVQGEAGAGSNGSHWKSFKES